MKRIRLAIVEDNRLLREGLAAMLREQSDIVVVAAFGGCDALLRKAEARFDILLLDLVLRLQNSLRLVESIKQKHPGVKIIVMDLAPAQSTLVDYVQAGVSGFVLKDATFVEFLHTIREVSRGARVLPQVLASSLLSQIADAVTNKGKGNPFRSVRMTNREREVIELIAEGLSNKQIALRLHLAVETVKSHVHNILEKLELHTRLEIASYRHIAGKMPASQSERDSND